MSKRRDGGIVEHKNTNESSAQVIAVVSKHAWGSFRQNHLRVGAEELEERGSVRNDERLSLHLKKFYQETGNVEELVEEGRFTP
jgi:hypothetical protein